LLRYQLYESSNEKVRLTSEINFIANFLSLKKTRRDLFDFTIQTYEEAPDLKTIEIPPNLFIPFVENGLKHSAEITDNQSTINIEKGLVFSCTNSIPTGKKVDSKFKWGFGNKKYNQKITAFI